MSDGMRVVSRGVLGFALLLSSLAWATDESRAPSGSSFWERVRLALQAQEPRARIRANTLELAAPADQHWSLPLVIDPQGNPTVVLLYLLDRQDATEFTPLPGHTCLALNVGSLSPGVERVLDPSQGPFCVAVQGACRAVQALRGLCGMYAPRVVLVGEQRGAAVALAVAALMPQDVALVCAYEPSLGAWPEGTLRATDLDLTAIAAAVQAPTLLAVGANTTRLNRQVAALVATQLPEHSHYQELPRRLGTRQAVAQQWEQLCREWIADQCASAMD